MDDQITEQVSEGTDSTLPGEGNADATTETTVQQGLTQENIREIMREERKLTARQVAEETAKAFRAMQSMSDKKAAQVKNMAEQQVEMMIQTGAQITPDMKSNYVNMLVNRYRESLADEAPEPAQVQTPQATETNPMFDAARATVQRTANKLGVSLDDEDSSEFNRLWQNVNSNPKTYQDFLDKAETYLEAKAKAGKTPPQARMASVVGNGGSNTPTKEALTAQLSKLLEHPHPKNLKKIEELQEKLKQ